MAHKATASASNAPTTKTTCTPSNTPGGACGSRAEIEYTKSPSTTTRSRSKPMSISRSMATPRPDHSSVPKNATSMAANNGVKRRVSVGARLSRTLCLASTNQEAITTAPAAPHGISHDWKNGPGSIPMLVNVSAMNAQSTPPPSAISTK